MPGFYDSLKRQASTIQRKRFVPAILTADELSKILRDRFGSVRVTGGCNGTELLTRCPYCGKSEKLSVNPAKRVFHCWHCDSSGTLGTLLGMDVRLIPSTVERPQDPKPRKDVVPPSFDPTQILSLRSLPEGNPAVIYLKSRGFNPHELADDFGLGYCARGRRFQRAPFDTSNTLFIPVVVNGRQVGWQARLLYDPKAISEEVLLAMGYTERKDDGTLKRPPKYMTSPGLSKSEVLYNIDSARRFDTVVVTEGVFDCIRVGRQGVATFGKQVSDNQRQMLVSLWRTVVLLLDPDAEASQSKLAEALAVPCGPRVVKVRLQGYKDAGECPRDELWRQINAAIASA